MITYEKIEQNAIEWFGKRYYQLTTYEKAVVFYTMYKVPGVTEKAIGEAVNLSPERVGQLVNEVYNEIKICINKGYCRKKNYGTWSVNA